MRFTISTSTVNALDATARKEFAQLIRALNPNANQRHIDAALTTDECTEFANHSLRRIDDEWVMEINDEVLFKYMRVYVRLAKFIAPLVAPFKAMACELVDDIEDIKRWMSMRK